MYSRSCHPVFKPELTIDRYVIRRRDLRALMLGFASFNEKEIQVGVSCLAKAIAKNGRGS
jgi:hypothetical protein